ncbi:hypothetical protein PJ311_03965 [Bacillus sp. CLL-7-23]|uniref:Spore coat protein C n=1 Tax=Bacillus changyiensis TaxID=3004103 RepID=A0ABT4X0E5_9BACI|nr:hypothetical protein [Bacillus changyiensis]MDA7025766.1 hypothetical protein [Bacillus changyiensis]
MEYYYDHHKKHDDYYWFKCKKVYFDPCKKHYDYDYDYDKKYYDHDHDKKYYYCKYFDFKKHY